MAWGCGPRVGHQPGAELVQQAVLAGNPLAIVVRNLPPRAFASNRVCGAGSGGSVRLQAGAGIAVQRTPWHAPSSSSKVSLRTPYLLVPPNATNLDALRTSSPLILRRKWVRRARGGRHGARARTEREWWMSGRRAPRRRLCCPRPPRKACPRQRAPACLQPARCQPDSWEALTTSASCRAERGAVNIMGRQGRFAPLSTRHRRRARRSLVRKEARGPPPSAAR